MNVSSSGGGSRRHGLTREQGDRLLRAWVAEAVAGLARDRPAADVPVDAILDRTGISRRTFYRLFGAKDAAVVAAGELQLTRLLGRMRAACWRQHGPRAQVRAALQELVSTLDDAPGDVRLCVIDAQAAAADPSWTTRRVAPWVDLARGELGLEPVLPRIATVELVAAIVAVLQTRLLLGGGEGDDLMAILAPLALRPHGRGDAPVRAPRSAAERVRSRAAGLASGAQEEVRDALAELAEAAVDAIVRGDEPMLRALDRAFAGFAPPSVGERQRAVLASLGALVSAAIAGGLGGAIATAELAGSRRSGLTPQAAACIELLVRRPGATASEVADALGIRHRSQASRLLVRLASEGLVASVPGHGRATSWRATVDGAAELGDRMASLGVRQK